MAGLQIIAACIGASVLYGILHNQVTARICVEYFTIGHPPIFKTDSPTQLAIGWGIIATWWVGAILGTLLAVAARAGTRPQREVRSLVRPVAVLMGVMAFCALTAGLAGFGLAEAGVVVLLEPLASAVPLPKHTAFIADLWAHLASYASGFLGGLVIIVHVWRSRAPSAIPDSA